MHPATEYWASGRGLGAITPAAKEWPEGESFPTFLANLLAGEIVIEFGCGPGRLAGLFPISSYVGVDVCAAAIERASSRHPNHVFKAVAPDAGLPYGTTILAHTVLLHVPDEDLAAVLGRFEATRVVVSEVMGRHWRRRGNPPVFNRDPADYIAAMDDAGYDLAVQIDRPYPHYPGTNLTLLDFRRAR